MATVSPAPRYLIVNGDDFGMSAQVNAGILHAHSNGILTNTSLMVAAPAWEDAVEIARSTASLGVGLHLTLVQGKAVLSPRLLPSLTDSAGNFSHNPTLAGLRYFFSRRARNEVRAECRAQIERFLETGLPLSHVDGHVNIHMHPVVLDALLGLSEEYRIPAIRLTREDVVYSLGLDSSQALRKRWEAFIFSHLAREAEKKLRRAGIRYPDYLFGLHQSGGLDERYVLGLLPQLRDGVTELYCHPSFLPCPEVQRWTPTYRRDAELDALTSAGVRETIATQAIRLVSYRDLSTLET
jgi:hopanoid biosynthesis associated protein HpnK